MVSGAVVITLNDLMLLDTDVVFLPFGHGEGYLALGLAIAAGGTWFLGVFDRGTTVYEERE